MSWRWPRLVSYMWTRREQDGLQEGLEEVRVVREGEVLAEQGGQPARGGEKDRRGAPQGPILRPIVLAERG